MPQPYLLVPSQGSDPADEWHRLGLEAQLANNLALAQQRYQQALRVDPRHALATQNLAIVFAQSNMINEALLTIERAALLDSKQSVIQVNWALMSLESERIDDALAAAQRAIDINPKDVNALLSMAMALSSAGMPEKAVPIYNQILDIDPKHGAAGPNACFTQTLTNATPAELLAQRKRWWDAHHWTGPKEPHRNDRNPDRPIRVGYVGGDFKMHSASFIFKHVLLHHTNEIDMYLYSSLPVDPNADISTKALQEKVKANWRDISTTNDVDAAAMIRKDKIDILVDLAAHTNGGRLSLFTHKPAPIQVTGWGFAHGTGCPEIDYFFADPVAVPTEERQHYAEKIVDLPCIVTIEPPVEYNLKGTSLPPIRKNGYFTFGTYSRYEKMSDQFLQTCAEILRQVPDSKLEFKDSGFRRPYSIKRVLSLMPDIAPDRLLFSIATSHPDHMLAYQQADLILDVWPHSGGVVGLEQIWMSVPIITLYGTQAAGRSTSSVLTAMGKSEWVAKTPEEYISKAVEWSDRIKDLAKARQTLRDELLNSPIVVGYVEKVEQAYRNMWKEWVDK